MVLSDWWVVRAIFGPRPPPGKNIWPPGPQAHKGGGPRPSVPDYVDGLSSKMYDTVKTPEGVPSNRNAAKLVYGATKDFMKEGKINAEYHAPNPARMKEFARVSGLAWSVFGGSILFAGVVAFALNTKKKWDKEKQSKEKPRTRIGG
eukprot:TRINITY_DN15303_c0_g1_i1.p1 TRINITY_DN15303_c0_g1~~TRINITY_DN15303_c0_g1_i1.p1  ORF type:complete len:147 (-),score=22.19 TRINITY_DN15303_c0_g1_i1:142-582(-)